MRVLRQILLAALVFFPAGDSPAGEAVVGPAWTALQQAREEAGVPPVERRALLDQVARGRARAIAALPHGQRLSYAEPVEAELRRAGVGRFVKARVHMNMVRGYRYPGETFARQWKTQPSWRTALSSGTSAVGLASASGSDGWVVMVVVLIEDAPEFDGAELERSILAAVNEVREQHGLNALQPLAKLADVARSHSEDMAARGYVDHRSPDGRESVDRVRSAGVTFHALAENIHMSSRQKDPVATAVSGWMNSPGHREAILTGHFTHSGVGVAEDADGTIYATQLFLLP